MVGSAVAGTDGLSSKITKSKVKSISNKQIDKAEPGLSVDHAKTADNATNATNATNASAVGGQTVAKVFTKIPTGTGATNVFSGNGLSVTVACPGGRLPSTRRRASTTRTSGATGRRGDPSR